MGLEIVEEARSISVETLERCGVYWDEEDVPYNVHVPYPHMNGEWYTRRLINPQLRNHGKYHSYPKVMSPAQASHHMYNPLKLGPNATMVIYCEGEYDTLSVIDCGFPAVGNQGARSFSPTWGRLFTGAVNIMALDNDTEGIESGKGLSRWLVKYGVKPIVFQGREEGQDLNDLHKEGKLLGMLIDLMNEYEIDW